MKIYTKILLITLPLIVIPAVIVSLISFQVSRTAIQSMAQDTLKIHLSNAIDICAKQASTIQEKESVKVTAVNSTATEAQTAAADALKSVTFGETGYTMVVDATGFVISHPVQHYIRQNISGESWFYDIYDKANGSFSFSWEGKKRLAKYQRFSDWGWYVISSESEGELLGPVERIAIYNGGLLALSLLIASVSVLFLARRLTSPIQALLAGTERIRNGELAVQIGVKTNDEIGILANAFNSMTGQLREVIGSLEQRVTERTQDLEKRALQLQTASEIAREAVSTHELDTLLYRSVNLIQERFSYYHVSILSLDDQRQFAILTAGAGEVGKIMVQRGFRVRIGEYGIVSHVVETGESRVINDVKTDFAYVKHPLLPDTASEATLPLKVGTRIIGVLDVQSQRVNDFTQDNVDVLQTLADQLAVAIENTRLLEELRTSLQETRTLYQQYIQESWSHASRGAQITGYQFDLSHITPFTRLLTVELRTRLLAGKAIPIRDREANEAEPGIDGTEHRAGDRAVLVAPLIMYDQLIGVLGVEAENPDHQWTPEEMALLEAISNQVSLTLDNARLVEVTQRRAARDRMVSEITNKMRRAVDMDTLIKTTVREITSAINVPEAFLQLGVPASVINDNESQQILKQGVELSSRGANLGGMQGESLPSERV